MRKICFMLLYLALSTTALFACGPQRVGQIEPVMEQKSQPNYFTHRLSASTNCAEIGEEVVFTAEVINESDQALTVLDTPPFDIIIKPYRYGGNAGPIQRWSDTPQYPRTINRMLSPGEHRIYTWTWIADAAYANTDTYKRGIAVNMPLALEFSKRKGFELPLSNVIVGVQANPTMGQGGVFCSRLR